MTDMENLPTEMPEGFGALDLTIDGFWDADDSNPLLFQATGIKLFDNKKDSKKASVLFIGTLERDTLLRVADSDSEKDMEIFPKGAVVGLWGKPGMKNLRRSFGVTTFVRNTGEEQDTGSGNKMKIFEVKWDKPEGGSRVPILEDNRNESRMDFPHVLGLTKQQKKAMQRYELQQDMGEDMSVPLDADGKPIF